MSSPLPSRPLLPLRVIAAAAVLLAGCGLFRARTHYNYAGEPDPRGQEYVLGPSDTLRITVWRNPELSGDHTIRPDGIITMPLIGDLHAAGKTPSALRAEISQRLSAFIRDEAATVSVAVTAVRSYRFLVSGYVEKPGVLSPDHYVTLTEALTLAGGPNKFASPEKTVVIRQTASGQTYRIPIDYEGILSGKRPEQNIVILRGDTIYVP